MRERRGSGPENNSQITTHVDPQVGTGGSQLYWQLIYLSKNQAPAYSVSDKGPYDRLGSKWYPNTINGKYEVV